MLIKFNNVLILQDFFCCSLLTFCCGIFNKNKNFNSTYKTFFYSYRKQMLKRKPNTLEKKLYMAKLKMVIIIILKLIIRFCSVKDTFNYVILLTFIFILQPCTYMLSVLPFQCEKVLMRLLEKSPRKVPILLTLMKSRLTDHQDLGNYSDTTSRVPENVGY